MVNKPQDVKKWALAGLFKRINLGEDPKILRSEADHLAKNVDYNDIAEVQQALIDEGYSPQLVHQLSAIFVLMGMRAKDNNSKGAMSNDHILQRIKVEHDLSRCFLADLNNVAETISGLKSLTDVSSEFRYLGHIIGHLSAMKEHIEREEDILFPYLKKYGWTGLYRCAQEEHDKIISGIDKLIGLIEFFNNVEFEEFKGWLIEEVQQLSPIMLEHFSYEDEILCPISLVVIDDVKIWERIKAISEDIGYCGVHE
jgi:DUF438 domain-containing protein